MVSVGFQTFVIRCGTARRTTPVRISVPPTPRRSHLEDTLKSSCFESGKVLAYLAYSERRSLWRSRLILGVTLSTPRKMKKAPSRMDSDLSTIFDMAVWAGSGAIDRRSFGAAGFDGFN